MEDQKDVASNSLEVATTSERNAVLLGAGSAGATDGRTGFVFGNAKQWEHLSTQNFSHFGNFFGQPPVGDSRDTPISLSEDNAENLSSVLQPNSEDVGNSGGGTPISLLEGDADNVNSVILPNSEDLGNSGGGTPNSLLEDNAENFSSVLQPNSDALSSHSNNSIYEDCDLLYEDLFPETDLEVKDLGDLGNEAFQLESVISENDQDNCLLIDETTKDRIVSSPTSLSPGTSEYGDSNESWTIVDEINEEISPKSSAVLLESESQPNLLNLINNENTGATPFKTEHKFSAPSSYPIHDSEFDNNIKRYDVIPCLMQDHSAENTGNESSDLNSTLSTEHADDLDSQNFETDVNVDSYLDAECSDSSNQETVDSKRENETTTDFASDDSSPFDATMDRSIWKKLQTSMTNLTNLIDSVVRKYETGIEEVTDDSFHVASSTSEFAEKVVRSRENNQNWRTIKILTIIKSLMKLLLNPDQDDSFASDIITLIERKLKDLTESDRIENLGCENPNSSIIIESSDAGSLGSQQNGSTNSQQEVAIESPKETVTRKRKRSSGSDVTHQYMTRSKMRKL